MSSRPSPSVRAARPRVAVRPWHQLPPEEVLAVMDAIPEGLSDHEASCRLKDFGPNELDQQEQRPAWLAFLDQFKSPLIAILIAAAVVAYFVGEPFDVWIILAIVLINAVLGFSLERRAEGAIAALQRMTSPRARVIRGGEMREIPASEVVEGDILALEGGDRVAADARLLMASELSVSEAEMTGESLPVSKSVAAIDEGEALPIGDRLNMVFKNTAVTQGRGRAVVVATGMATEIGKIAGHVAASEGGETPVQKDLAAFGKQLGLLVLGVIAVVMVGGILIGRPFGEMVYVAVSLAVAAIPEGLPIVVSVLFAIGVSRMAKRHALVRRLPAVEGLGAATLIGSDKTGTLTRNEMTVTRLFLGGQTLRISGEGYGPEGDVHDEDAPPGGREGVERLAAAGALCNDAVVEQDEGEWRVLGDPTEGALITLARKLEAEADWERLEEIPFSSERKWMATLHRAPDGETVAFAKGALERLLPMASHWVDADGAVRPLDEAGRAQLEQAAEAMACDALRVLALAEARGVDRLDPEAIDGQLTMLGLTGMIDPARPEAVRAVQTCQEAGIRVVMITGDHKSTALAIASRLGLARADHPEAVIEGVELERLTDTELEGRIDQLAVFARVSPSHKLRIVKALQKRGAIVGMTGDGVNDAPALAQADIGIAMGITGTEVAKGAADMVLADDNFASIVAAVEEGRTIADNLRKVVRYLITTATSSILTIGAAIFAGLPLPLLPPMVLWINLVADGVMDKTLALEQSEPDIMHRGPRLPGAALVSREAIVRILLMGAFMATGTLGMYAWELSQGVTVEVARTKAFVTLAAFQWFSAFAYRSTRTSLFKLPVNRFMLGGLILALFLQVLAVYAWPLQLALHTVPIPPLEFVGAVAVATSLLVVTELSKWASGRARP